MSDDPKNSLNPQDIAVLAKAARLTLGDGRDQVVAVALDGVLKSFDLLDDVDIAEIPPTNSFDPRWRG